MDAQAIGAPVAVVTRGRRPASTSTGWIHQWRAAALARVEPALEELRRNAGPLTPATSHVAAAPGKRLRSLLTLASASLGPVFAEPDPDAVAAAAAIEAIHEASLLHDDIVDGAAVRRDQPAVAARFGVRTAGNAGVYLAGKGIARLADICTRRAIPVDFGAFKDLALAQILDSLPPAADFDDHYRRLRAATDGKTGVLFILAVRLGAAFARRSMTAHAADLDGFALALGRAFQIRDDILDVEGDTVDLHRGVLNWPLCFWARMAADWRAATARLQRCGDDPDQTLAIRAGVMSSGALDEARSLLHAEVDRAARHLEPLPAGPGRDLLVHFVDDLARR